MLFISKTINTDNGIEQLKTYSKRNVQPYFDATIDHILVHFKGSKGLHMHQNFVMELFEFH